MLGTAVIARGATMSAEPVSRESNDFDKTVCSLLKQGTLLKQGRQERQALHQVVSSTAAPDAKPPKPAATALPQTLLRRRSGLAVPDAAARLVTETIAEPLSQQQRVPAASRPEAVAIALPMQQMASDASIATKSDNASGVKRKAVVTETIAEPLSQQQRVLAAPQPEAVATAFVTSFPMQQMASDAPIATKSDNASGVKKKAVVPMSTRAMQQASGKHKVLTHTALVHDQLRVAQELRRELKSVFKGASPLKHEPSPRVPSQAGSAGMSVRDCLSDSIFSALPGDLLLSLVACLGISDILSCAMVARSWSHRASSVGRALFSDDLWRSICKRHWSTKSPRFHMDTPQREAALQAAHPGSSWKRMFHLADADGQRYEMTPAELKHLHWKSHTSAIRIGAVDYAGSDRQHVIFSEDAPKPSGVSAGARYCVARLMSWEWLLIGQGSRFISTQPRPRMQRSRGKMLDLEEWLSTGGDSAELKVVDHMHADAQWSPLANRS